jgi:hypothetical protein
MDSKKQQEQRKIERHQVKLILEQSKKVRERFEYADTAQWLLQDKNLEDLSLVSNAISEWILNPKIGPEKKKELTELLQSIWRVMAYCQNLETLCKTSVSRYIDAESKFDKLQTEICKLKLEKHNLELSKNKDIENLKKEIEFISK